jgi:hypothetical protein
MHFPQTSAIFCARSQWRRRIHGLPRRARSEFLAPWIREFVGLIRGPKLPHGGHFVPKFKLWSTVPTVCLIARRARPSTNPYPTMNWARTGFWPQTCLQGRHSSLHPAFQRKLGGTKGAVACPNRLLNTPLSPPSLAWLCRPSGLRFVCGRIARE